MSKQLLVIFGATGNQGSSIINFVLADPELSSRYTIRGLTRDPSSSAAKALKEKGVEVVKCNISNDEEVRAGLQGASDVFLMTVSSPYQQNNSLSTAKERRTVYTPTGGKDEEKLGNHLADLVVESGAKYVIWSSMISPKHLSNGKYPHVDLFESKYEVEQYIRTLPIKSTHFVPAHFYQNMHNHYKPKPLGDGTYGLINFFDPGTSVPYIDIAEDTGKWIGPMLADQDKFAGKTVACATRLYTQTEVAEAMSKSSGKTVKHVQISLQEWESYIPETTRQMMSEMWQHIGDTGYYGAKQDEELEWGRQHEKGKLTEIDEYLKREPLVLD